MERRVSNLVLENIFMNHVEVEWTQNGSSTIFYVSCIYVIQKQICQLWLHNTSWNCHRIYSKDFNIKISKLGLILN